MKKIWLSGMLFAAACQVGAGDPVGTGTSKGRPDTAWYADTSFEVGGTLRSTLTHAATGDWANLATDRALQEQIIDTQIKYGKKTLEDQGWMLSQLADK